MEMDYLKKTYFKFVAIYREVDTFYFSLNVRSENFTKYIRLFHLLWWRSYAKTKKS